MNILNSNPLNEHHLLLGTNELMPVSGNVNVNDMGYTCQYQNGEKWPPSAKNSPSNRSPQLWTSLCGQREARECFQNAFEIVNLRAPKFSHLNRIHTPFNVWGRYLKWNFKGYVWNSSVCMKFISVLKCPSPWYMENSIDYSTHMMDYILLYPWGHFTEEVYPWLVEVPLNSNVDLANLGLNSCVKEAIAVSIIFINTLTKLLGLRWNYTTQHVK